MNLNKLVCELHSSHALFHLRKRQLKFMGSGIKDKLDISLPISKCVEDLTREEIRYCLHLASVLDKYLDYLLRQLLFLMTKTMTCKKVKHKTPDAIHHQKK